MNIWGDEERTKALVLLSCCLVGMVQPMTFEYCWFFSGTCSQSCLPGTFALYRTSWCSDRSFCCVRRFAPVVSYTTTAAPTTSVPDVSACGMAMTSGMSMVTGRIIGGRDATKCEFPWLVFIALEPGDDNPCGGALIDDRHVLTAAHCFSQRHKFTPELTIGEYKRKEVAPDEKFTTTDYTLFIHPDYVSRNYFNDIAIVRLNTPVDFGSYRCIQPVCLPEEDTPFPEGTSCIVAGWGVTEPVYDIFNPPTPEVLTKATIEVVDESLCERKFSRFYNRTIETCAGQLDGSMDSCDGDSGGPLMCRTGSGNEFYAAGIVSSGAKCAQPQTPAIYTDVTHFVPWIRRIINQGR